MSSWTVHSKELLVVNVGKTRDAVGKVNQPHAAYVVQRLVEALKFFLEKSAV